MSASPRWPSSVPRVHKKDGACKLGDVAKTDDEQRYVFGGIRARYDSLAARIIVVGTNDRDHLWRRQTRRPKQGKHHRLITVLLGSTATRPLTHKQRLHVCQTCRTKQRVKVHFCQYSAADVV